VPTRPELERFFFLDDDEMMTARSSLMINFMGNAERVLAYSPAPTLGRMSSVSRPDLARASRS
jgi:hypothetical protein